MGYFIFSGISGLVAHAGRHNISGLAPRIFFIFAPLLREEGGGASEGRGHFSKITGKRGKKKGGGGRGRCRKRVGGIFGGEGSLIFILRVEEPP